MADQLRTSLSLFAESTNYDMNKILEATESLAKQGLAAGFQDFTSDSTDITIGDLASTDQGTMILNNLSESNTLQYGSTDYEFELPPEDWHKLRIASGVTVKAKTLTGSVKLEKYIFGE